MTPFEKLKSLPDVEKHLRPRITIAPLEEQARAMNDLDAAVALKRARARLFELIDREADPRHRRSALTDTTADALGRLSRQLRHRRRAALRAPPPPARARYP